MGCVGASYHEGKIYLDGWESDGPGHVPVEKLTEAFPLTVGAKVFGQTAVKFLRASQQLNIPAVGWDRRTVKPL
jgi:hypothetical protein